MSTDSVPHEDMKSTGLPADSTEDSCTSVLFTKQTKVIYLVLLVVLHF